MVELAFTWGQALGAGASLVGASPLLGFLLAGIVGGGSIEAAGAERVRDRDVATGVVLGAAAGLTALLLYFVSSSTSATVCSIS